MISRILRLVPLMALPALLSGCILAGYIAATAPPATVEPQYTGLVGQRVAVIVWADRGIRIDWPTIQSDVTGALQQKLATQTDKKKALEGATFPYSAVSIARFQEDHPEVESDPIEKTALRLGVDRLVYVELERFATRSELTDELFKGTATASVKAVEVVGGVGRIVYEESDVQVVFPPSGPKEGSLRGSDYQIYAGTVDALAQRISDRFVPYQEEP